MGDPVGARGHWPVLAAQALVVCLLALLVGRLWYLQVPMGEHYRALAESNHVHVVAPAVQGRFLDTADCPPARHGSPAPAGGECAGERPRPADGAAHLSAGPFEAHPDGAVRPADE
ncbi:MAG TPA: hypothetical protein VKZ89_06455 [Thermobifida alba]|nr:hypothetical protein [Thermobifida alba]